jgi:hypothetical protein
MYPTKKQILREPRPKFKWGIMKEISKWKKGFYEDWNGQGEHTQLWALQLLAEICCDMEGRPRVLVNKENINRYRKIGWIIELTTPFSIISLLHELAHHLFGPDELTACRWSVWLYQLRFRNDYNNLIWNEHTLMKAPSKSVTEKSQFKGQKMVTTKSRAKQKGAGK